MLRHSIARFQNGIYANRGRGAGCLQLAILLGDYDVAMAVVP